MHSYDNVREGRYFRKPISRVTFFEAEYKKRVLAISTRFKTTKTVVENGYFQNRVR